ncbi:MAG TPA: FtsX-like permease family protein [Kofleriaceae bacterium]|nr:FtsX-like permease family protein [Kofleriaceae bacterium]
MNLATYSRRNMFRRPGRTILTMIVVFLAVLIFALIRTVVAMWNIGAEEALQDRIAIRHKASITMELPKKYIDEVRQVPGIRAATWANWFGGKDPKKRVPFFATFATDPDSWFSVYDDMQIAPDVMKAWKETKNGAILGDVLAHDLHVKPGDKLTITSDIYKGDWEFTIVGLYKPLRRTVDRSTLLFRWDYLNDNPELQPSMKDKIGWIIARTSDPKGSSSVTRAVDKLFDDRDDQTLSMSERAFSLSFLGGFASLLRAFDIGSMVILLIVLLVLANTNAMSTRERTHEYGVLRAIGFQPRHVILFAMAESALIALIGALVGVAVLALLINGAVGPWLEQHMSSLFPFFRVPASVMVTSLVAALALGAGAAALPAIRASRLKVTDSLRRID